MLRKIISKMSGDKNPTFVASVAVYSTDGGMFVIAQQMTDLGRVAVEPMLRLDPAADPAEIGAVVLQCLDAFRQVDGDPQAGHLEKFLEFVGARSWKGFARKAINVSVEGRTDETVSMSAARADSRGAYAYGEFSECTRDPVAIGELLKRLIESA